jgi:hypothetical protein
MSKQELKNYIAFLENYAQEAKESARRFILEN